MLLLVRSRMLKVRMCDSVKADGGEMKSELSRRTKQDVRAGRRALITS